MMSSTNAELWEAQFSGAGIPSLNSAKPSGGAIELCKLVPSIVGKPQRVLDIGCGTGRNSIFFAERGLFATGVDFAVAAITRGRESAVNQGLAESRATFVVGDICEPWQFETCSFDALFDSFTFRHLIDDCDVAHYLKEAGRVAKPNAVFVLSLAADDDPHYSNQEVLGSDHEGITVVRDFYTGIASRLYSREALMQILEENWSLERFTAYGKPSAIHGHVLRRRNFRLVLRRR